MTSLLDTWFEARDRRIPAGIIVFSKAASTPDGWQAFTAANGRLIIGAGDDHNPGANGGSDVVTKYSGALGSAGGHGGGNGDRPVAGSGGIYNFYRFDQYSGWHTHNLENAVFIPEKDTLKLIKATTHHSNFPAQAVLIGMKSFDGLSITNTAGHLIGAASSVGSISATAKLEISASGGHRHSGGYYTSTSGSSYTRFHGDFAGVHSPHIPLSITENLKKVMVSLWTHAAEEIKQAAGMIAMWESLIPPPGWGLCDGSRGTEDLRNIFIKGVAAGSEGSRSGDGTVTIGALSGSIQHTVNHGHWNGYYNPDFELETGETYHNDETWVHSHSISQSAKTITWLPPYYALSFIQKLP